MKTEGLAQRWIANLSILLIIVSFCFLNVGLANAGSYNISVTYEPTIEDITIEESVHLPIVHVDRQNGIASASSYTYTLSGGPSPETPLVVDDDLEVRVNGETVFIDNDKVWTGSWWATWRGKPITFSASPGDVLQIIATNPGGGDIALSPLYLHVKGQSLKLSDGVTRRRSEIYTFFDKEFTISIPTGSISISSTPSGAKVYLDGVYKGTTPLSLENVVSKSHTVRVVKEGYKEETKAVSLGAGEAINLNIQLKRLTGSISVSSSPSGASVYLNGLYKGVTPITLTDVPIGTYSIKLTKSGYGDVTKTISVSAGKTTYVSETLTGYGSLSISSNPPGASVYLDGSYKGETPLSISNIVEGVHSIKLTKSGYGDVTKTISVSAGKTTYVSETLPFATWLLASILGIIALIIIIIGIFVTIRRKRAKSTVTKAEEITEKGKTEEVKIPELEEVRERLRETFPEKDAARLANAFRIAQEIRSSYCNTDTKASEISKEFDILKMYLNEKGFLDEVEGIQRRINAELREDERLDDKHVEEVKDFCDKFTEMWIAKFLK